jgi:hypothetical protein
MAAGVRDGSVRAWSVRRAGAAECEIASDIVREAAAWAAARGSIVWEPVDMR